MSNLIRGTFCSSFENISTISLFKHVITPYISNSNETIHLGEMYYYGIIIINYWFLNLWGYI